MSEYQHKEGFGALFKSEKKSDKAPDYKGTIMAGGNVYELAGWVKQGSKGSFLSLSAKVKAPEGSKPVAPYKVEPKANEPKLAVKGFEDWNDEPLPF